ncbi:hypothetical protein ED733_000035 [Metarhizium rileyi]|uniref:Uncharacterized protein n=1 Tax=Metarhizium rileyi (strain RCEF 4871) TaxID=1649241 RepID=A0A5C6G3J7_METRR|nr:hypothetical protein ED733_000035 [Metarhizium rileyi]
MSASIMRLKKALDVIKQIQSRLEVNNFTKETFVNPPNDLMLQLRQSYMVDINTISENLDLKQNDPLRKTYKDLFSEARGLHGQCTILDHKYEVAGVAIKIDWAEVWQTLVHRLPNNICTKLQNAIEKEDSA